MNKSDWSSPLAMEEEEEEEDGGEEQEGEETLTQLERHLLS